MLDRSNWIRLPSTLSAVLRLLWVAIWLTACLPVIGQDLSWVKGALERSKSASRESLPAWQYDPRVAAGQVDASLNGLAVVNPDRLWAVGDRGLILATTDGGRTWNVQSSGTSLNLMDIAFFDERNGVCVGGSVEPLSQSSVGVVLITSDAGQTWQVISTAQKAPLPRLTGVSVSTSQGIVAWGDYSSPHNTAVFESPDRGRSWHPVASSIGHTQCVARNMQGLQLAVDRAGRVAQVPSNSRRPLTQLALPTQLVWSLSHAPRGWLAVGDGGTVAHSSDGLQWSDHSLPLSPKARSLCSLRTIHVFDQNIWIGGWPGSILLHSPDAGASWRIVPTGQNWKIASIKFIDRNRGWLVTESGGILATRDGGSNWYVQRQPAKRLGLQMIAASTASIAWPALVDVTWNAQQTASLLVLHRTDPEDAIDFAPDAPSTLAALGVQTGLTSSQLLPHWPIADARVRSAAALADLYQSGLRRTEVALAANVHQRLVAQIRAERPTVLLVDDPIRSPSETSQLTDAAARAMSAAALSDAELSWLATELHLEPWSVSKLFNVTLTEKADLTIAADQLLRDSGLAASDVLAPVYGWHGLEMPNSTLRCLLMNSGNQVARQNLLISSDYHADTGRLADLSKVGNMQLVMGRIHRDRAWQALAPSDLNRDEDLGLWLGKMQSVLEKTPRHEIGPALTLLAQRCRLASQWARWQSVLERSAQHAAWTDSSRWASLALLRLAASDERIAWEQSSARANPNTTEDRQQDVAATGKFRNPLDSNPFDSASDGAVIQASGRNSLRAPADTAQANGNADTQSTFVQTASAQARALSGSTMVVARLKAANTEYHRVREADAVIAARPDIQLAHYARLRSLAELAGDPAPDVVSLQQLAASSQLPGWQQAAQQEVLLASGKAAQITWAAHATRTATPPELDGQGNDACWSRSKPITLSNPFQLDASDQSELPMASASLAYDDEFLYVWISCPELSNPRASKNRNGLARRYDMDLDGTDHVVISLDTDRDYVSTVDLAVNRMGHTYDRCCQTNEWNPRWYVAAGQQSAGWTAEIAIRLSDMTMHPSVDHKAWCISLFRYIPEWGVQSWSQLRSAQPRPQGNGLLFFDP